MHGQEPPGSSAWGHGALNNLAQLVSRNAQRSPDRVALVEPLPERRALTWAETDVMIDRVSAGLAGYGLVAGHRVAMCGPNSIEFVVAYFAVLRAGFVAVPLNPDYSPGEIEHCLAATGARLLLCATDYPVADQLPPSGVVVLPLTAESLARLGATGTGPVTSPRDREALAALVYTAGTSGDPKPVMLSHRALLAHTEHVDPLQVIHSDTVALALLPMAGIFGLNAVVGSWAQAGATLVIMRSTDGMLDVITNERVTNLPLAPALLYRLLNAHPPLAPLDDDSVAPLHNNGLAPLHNGPLAPLHNQLRVAFRSVQTVLSGAAPLPGSLSQRFAEQTGVRVDQGYGLTEAGPGVAATLAGEVLGPGHVGRALPGVAVRIGSGTDDSDPAEIWVRGDNLFSGYWPDGTGGPGPDGWFGTGDIGYSQDGELFLVDRARELMAANGFHIYPAEIEGVISQLAGVEAVAVLGRPGGPRGDEIIALVVGPDLDLATVAEHCATRLPSFKRPSSVQLVDELPRGATGKIKKGTLRIMLGSTERPEQR